MGACAILPRIIGHGRASELLYTGRFMAADESERCGFYNKVVSTADLMSEASTLARSLADGPTFAHAITKSSLHVEWNMSIEDALDHEAQAQALCMQTQDFARAYRAFTSKGTPAFEGN
jgi:enoyl-CoA hydratase/carnithine racemase